MAGEPMTPEQVTPERMDAGRDYLRALAEHGVEVEGAGWAVDRTKGGLSLVLISSLVDRVGPKVVYDTLFRAYDAAVTPASIDPWIVELFSPESVLAERLRGSMHLVQGKATFIGLDSKEMPSIMGPDFYYAGKYLFQSDWIYVPLQRAPRQESQLKKWQRFTRHVDRAAA